MLRPLFPTSTFEKNEFFTQDGAVFKIYLKQVIQLNSPLYFTSLKKN